MGISRISKIKEKKISLLPLLNYNNGLPTIGNDSQNGIYCRWQVTIICELTEYIIVTNNSVLKLKLSFILIDHNMVV
jgi:hypothetical protein